MTSWAGATSPPGRWPSRRRGAGVYPGGEFFLPCVLVIKRLTEGERHDKSRLTDILRQHGVST